MNDRFMIKIETWHKPDMGEQENVSHVMASCGHTLPTITLSKYITGIITYITDELDLMMQNWLYVCKLWYCCFYRSNRTNANTTYVAS